MPSRRRKYSRLRSLKSSKHLVQLDKHHDRNVMLGSFYLSTSSDFKNTWHITVYSIEAKELLRSFQFYVRRLHLVQPVALMCMATRNDFVPLVKIQKDLVQ